MKTRENIEVIKQIPLDRIMLETDAPWCDIRPSHASFEYLSKEWKPIAPQLKKEKFEMGSMVKGRNEPCQILQIVEIVAQLKGITREELTLAVLKNTERVFKRLL